MKNIITSDDDKPSEEKESRIKSLLTQIFSRNDTVREQLIEFFEDIELPVRNDQIQMILGVIRLLNFTAEKIKIPLGNMVNLPIDASLKDTVQVIKKSGHSRVPVYKETGGHKKYVGLLYAKDIIGCTDSKKQKFHLEEYTRKLQFIPESQSLLSLLREMRMHSQHLMLTVDEYGEVNGLITLEDILEEIVGDIRDEYDKNTLPIKEIGHRLYEIDASVNLTDINKKLALNLPEEHFSTLAGFMLHELKGSLSKESRVEYGNIILTISSFTGHTIQKVTAYIPP